MPARTCRWCWRSTCLAADADPADDPTVEEHPFTSLAGESENLSVAPNSLTVPDTHDINRPNMSTVSQILKSPRARRPISPSNRKDGLLCLPENEVDEYAHLKQPSPPPRRAFFTRQTSSLIFIFSSNKENRMSETNVRKLYSPIPADWTPQ